MKLSPQDLQASLRARYATKQFDPTRKLDPAAWEALKESLVLAPSSFGLQPWRFLIVNNAETRSQLREVSWNQPQITDADRLVVITTRTDLTTEDIDRWMHCLAAAHGKSHEDLAPYRGMIEGFSSAMDTAAKQDWNTRQCYIALGQLMTSAAVIGIDTCPLEGIDKAAYNRILALEGTGYTTAVACAIGYRSEEDAYAAAPKARFAQGDVIREIN
jgi:nitroreductase